MKEDIEKDPPQEKPRPEKPRDTEGTWANLIKVRQTLINRGGGRILKT